MRLHRIIESTFITSACIITRTAKSATAFISPSAPKSPSNQQEHKHLLNTILCQTNRNLVPPPPSISLPVWSLAAATNLTKNEDESNATSMNIVTYAIPVSVASPKLWIVSLFHGTMTKDSFLANGGGILQLLRPEQKTLVAVLGKQSGYDTSVNKAHGCSMLGYSWIGGHPFGNISVLPGCISYIHLRAKKCIEAGDHVAILCEVVQTAIWDEASKHVVLCPHETVPQALDQSKVLYSGLLREEGLI